MFICQLSSVETRLSFYDSALKISFNKAFWHVEILYQTGLLLVTERQTNPVIASRVCLPSAKAL